MQTLISYFGLSMHIVIIEGTKTIGKYALNDEVEIISLPRSLEKIESFPMPISLKIIYIPIGTKQKFEKLLPMYKNYLIEQDVSEEKSSE